MMDGAPGWVSTVMGEARAGCALLIGLIDILALAGDVSGKVAELLLRKGP
jgi:hypothetical protein